MAERGSTGTHKNVLSPPAPPVIGSNHRGSHASSFLRSRKSICAKRRKPKSMVHETHGIDRNINKRYKPHQKVHGNESMTDI